MRFFFHTKADEIKDIHNASIDVDEEAFKPAEQEEERTFDIQTIKEEPYEAPTDVKNPEDEANEVKEETSDNVPLEVKNPVEKVTSNDDVSNASKDVKNSVDEEIDGKETAKEDIFDANVEENEAVMLTVTPILFPFDPPVPGLHPCGAHRGW